MELLAHASQALHPLLATSRAADDGATTSTDAFSVEQPFAGVLRSEQLFAAQAQQLLQGGPVEAPETRSAHRPSGESSPEADVSEQAAVVASATPLLFPWNVAGPDEGRLPPSPLAVEPAAGAPETTSLVRSTSDPDPAPTRESPTSTHDPADVFAARSDSHPGTDTTQPDVKQRFKERRLPPRVANFIPEPGSSTVSTFTDEPNAAERRIAPDPVRDVGRGGQAINAGDGPSKRLALTERANRAATVAETAPRQPPGAQLPTLDTEAENPPTHGAAHTLAEEATAPDAHVATRPTDVLAPQPPSEATPEQPSARPAPRTPSPSNAPSVLAGDASHATLRFDGSLEEPPESRPGESRSGKSRSGKSPTSWLPPEVGATEPSYAEAPDTPPSPPGDGGPAALSAASHAPRRRAARTREANASQSPETTPHPVARPSNFDVRDRAEAAANVASGGAPTETPSARSAHPTAPRIANRAPAVERSSPAGPEFSAPSGDEALGSFVPDEAQRANPYPVPSQQRPAIPPSPEDVATARQSGPEQLAPIASSEEPRFEITEPQGRVTSETGVASRASADSVEQEAQPTEPPATERNSGSAEPSGADSPHLSTHRSRRSVPGDNGQPLPPAETHYSQPSGDAFELTPQSAGETVTSALERSAAPEHAAPRAAPASPESPLVAPHHQVAEPLLAIRRMQPGELREMDLQLDPPELGRVRIRIRERRGGVRVDIEAGVEAIEAIEAELPQLRDALRHAGVRIDELRLDAPGQHAFESGHESGSQHQRSATDHGHSRPDANSSRLAEPARADSPSRVVAGMRDAAIDVLL